MKRIFRIKLFTLLMSLVLASWPSGPMAQSDSDFKGKTIRVIIGTSTGGGVDLYARLVAQFLGKHLPGEPNIVPQNMPGASSVVAANFIYTMAKPDGLNPGRVARRSLFRPGAWP